MGGCMPKEKLTQERLKELLHYCPETGVFTWIGKTSTNTRVKKGMQAGCIRPDGYRYIKICQRAYNASRLAWLYQEGYFPENEVDHINRVTNDDRWENLRHVSRQCNARNRGIHKNNSSGVTGIYWHKEKSKWRAKIKVASKTIHIGYYSTKEAAAKARWQAEKKYNFPNCNSTSLAYLYLKERGLA